MQVCQNWGAAVYFNRNVIRRHSAEPIWDWGEMIAKIDNAKQSHWEDWYTKLWIWPWTIKLTWDQPFACLHWQDGSNSQTSSLIIIKIWNVNEFILQNHPSIFRYCLCSAGSRRVWSLFQEAQGKAHTGCQYITRSPIVWITLNGQCWDSTSPNRVSFNFKRIPAKTQREYGVEPKTLKLWG